MFDLTDKVALITGSTRGIGLSIAENFAKQGAKVVIASRKHDECENVAARLAAAGHQAIAVPCDVGKNDQQKRMVEAVLAKWGRIDSLICNAATNTHFGPIGKASEEAYDKIMSVNVKSVWQLTSLVIPQMAARKDGTVIVVGSIAGLKGNPLLGLYGVGKAALFSMVRNLAAEWGPSNIRINAIAPGLIKTDFAKALWENDTLRAAREAATPLRRIGDPDDIGGIAVMLAARAGAFMTGQVIVADGGVTVV
ncbi:MAG: SDR family NAD(P)-dependent oxidoreductase [Burkholderiales bacterium]